jgi:hypothetical protein
MKRVLGILATASFAAALVSACTIGDDAEPIDDSDLAIEGGVGSNCSPISGEPCDSTQPPLTCCNKRVGTLFFWNCRSLTNDVNNCGSCNHVCTCPAGQTPSCFMSACICAG